MRWNYISDAHTALMLLSHQHIAQAEMVCVHVCVSTRVWVIAEGAQSEALTLNFFFAKIQKHLPILGIELCQNSVTFETQMCEVSMP